MNEYEIINTFLVDIWGRINKIEERSLGINKFLNEHEKQKRRKERTRWKKLNTLKLMDYYIQN